MDNDLHLILGRVEGKLDAAMAQLVSLGTNLSETNKTLAKVSERVSVLEAQRGHLKWAVPILISLVSVATVVWGQLKGIIH